MSQTYFAKNCKAVVVAMVISSSYGLRNRDIQKKNCKKLLQLPCSCSTDLGDPLGFGSPASYADTATEGSPSQHQVAALGNIRFLLLTLPLKPPKLNSQCYFIFKTNVNQTATWSKSR